MFYLGIDPGVKGSYALLDKDAEIIELERLPTIKLRKTEIDVPELQLVFNDIIRSCEEPVVACLETSSAMPGQGVSSMFSFGKTYGSILASLIAVEMPFVEVHPRTWTKEMYKGINGKGKERAYAVAKKMFPKWKPKYKYEQDWADSLLIAQYGRKHAW